MEKRHEIQWKKQNTKEQHNYIHPQYTSIHYTVIFNTLDKLITVT